MAGKASERKSIVKSLRNASNTMDFVLPDSLPCSEMEFPILIDIKTRRKANWNNVVHETEKFYEELEEIQRKKEPVVNVCAVETASDYIKDNVFPLLLPALEETLEKAETWQALRQEKCFFNGIDHLAQLLWTNNPRYPDRKLKNQHLFNMYWVRMELEKNPRPLYPKSWLWTEDHAATVIQKTVRRHFVLRQEHVQEMREFWKKLDIERNMPELTTNPFLAKRFAEEKVEQKKAGSSISAKAV